MELGFSPVPNSGTFRHMDAHVCTDDIDSLQSAMQIFIDRVYMGKDMDKQDKTRATCSSLIIAYNIEYIGRMF